MPPCVFVSVSMSVCFCARACIYTCVYLCCSVSVCIGEGNGICTTKNEHVYVYQRYINEYTCVCSHVYARVGVSAYVYMCVYVCVYVCVCVCVRVLMHAFAHTCSLGKKRLNGSCLQEADIRALV